MVGGITMKKGWMQAVVKRKIDNEMALHDDGFHYRTVMGRDVVDAEG